MITPLLGQGSLSQAGIMKWQATSLALQIRREMHKGGVT